MAIERQKITEAEGSRRAEMTQKEGVRKIERFRYKK